MNKILSTAILSTLTINAPYLQAAAPLNINGSTTVGGVTTIPVPMARVEAAYAFITFAADDNNGNPLYLVDLVTNNTIGSVILSNGPNGRYGYIAGMDGKQGTPPNTPGKYTATYRLDVTNPAVRALSEGQSLTDTIAYTVTALDDSRVTNTGLLTITILAPKIKPIAYDDFATVEVDPTKAVASTLINVKSNDVNAGDAYLTGSPTGQYGFLDLGANAAAGIYTYKLDLNNQTVRGLKSGETLTDTFSYRIRAPGTGTLTAEATIRITIVGSTNAAAEVTAVNDTVSLIVDSATTNPAVTYNVLKNDINADKASLASSTVGQYGSLDGGLAADGTFTYRVNLNNPAVQRLLSTAGASLSETFTYRVNGKAPNDRVSSTATVSINIVAGNVVPFKALAISETIVAEEAVVTTDGKPATTTAGVIKGNLKTLNENYLNVKDSNIRAEITGSQFGKYGTLLFSSSTNDFSYTLSANVSEIQELRSSSTPLQDIFNYKITDRYGVTATAQIVINIVSRREYVSTDNVEIESNNKSSLATPLNTGANMRGNLKNGSDRDWYVINTNGNETFHIELCPTGTACAAQKAWVLYIFDASKLTKDMEESTYPLYLKREDGANDGTYPKITGNSDHMYLLSNRGVFGDALIGGIDPCYGNTSSVDISAPTLAPGETRNYFVAISSPLARDGSGASGAAATAATCSDGSVILKKPAGSIDVQTAATTNNTTVGNTTTSSTSTTKTVNLLQDFISVFPNSDDQYTFRVTRTGISPLAIKTTKDEAVYNANAGTVQIPKVRVGEQLMSVQLQQLPTGKSANAAISFGITGSQNLNEPLQANPLLGTYNDVNKIVKLPKVTVESTDKSYSVDLQYKPSNQTLEFLSATPVK